MRARVFGPPVLVALLAAPALGQGPSTAPNKWSSLGPFARGGGIRALAVALAPRGARVHASTDSGIFRSLDSGASWTSANEGLGFEGFRSQPLVAAFAVDPLDSSVVYAAGGEGVFKSTDEGASWRSISVGLNGQEIATLVVDPRTPTTLYAGSTSYPSGAFKSTDGGDHWFALNVGLGFADASTIAIDPSSPNRLYLGGVAGVFQSNDGGATWSLVLVGPPGVGFRFVRVDPVAPAVVYAGGASVFKSVDAGRTWAPADLGLPFNAISSFEIDPIDHRVLLAGLDGGPGSSSGLWRSVDGGGHWLRVEPLLAPGGVRALAIDPARGTHVFAGLRLWDPVQGPLGGVLESDDFGATWTDLAAPLRGRYVHALAAFQGPQDVVYAALSSDYLTSVAPIEIWRSDDGGGHWSKTASGGLTDPNVRAFAIHPVDPSILCVATPSGIFRSGNAGETWERLPNAPSGETAILFDAARPTRLLAAADGQVFESVDSGAGWTPLGTGTIGRIAALAIEPRTSSVYAASLNGLFRLSGLTWAMVWSAPVNGADSVVFAPGAIVVATVYTGPTPGGLLPAGYLLRSTDSGATWEATNGIGANAVAGDPTSPSQLYAATILGVFRSRNAGASWEPVNDGLGVRHIPFIAVASGSRVYAGSSGAGIFGARFVIGPRRPVPREVPSRGPPASSPSRAIPER